MCINVKIQIYLLRVKKIIIIVQKIFIIFNNNNSPQSANYRL